jgi:hypothetical protein
VFLDSVSNPNKPRLGSWNANNLSRWHNKHENRVRDIWPDICSKISAWGKKHDPLLNKISPLANLITFNLDVYDKDPRFVPVSKLRYELPLDCFFDLVVLSHDPNPIRVSIYRLSPTQNRNPWIPIWTNPTNHTPLNMKFNWSEKRIRRR